jgi:hypothetical protein
VGQVAAPAPITGTYVQPLSSSKHSPGAVSDRVAGSLCEGSPKADGLDKSEDGTAESKLDGDEDNSIRKPPFILLSNRVGFLRREKVQQQSVITRGRLHRCSGVNLRRANPSS